MFLNKRKINNVLEYILIVILFFIGLNKGGYYKEDSLVFVYIIQIISALFYLLNIKDIKKNSIVSLFLIIFAISYFIPIIFNVATISGALNIGTRIFTMYLIYCLVINSENKEKYIKSLVVFTCIFCVLGVDEIGNRILNKPLSFLGSGYVEDKVDKISSIFQYSNLLGILCVISIIYLLDKVLKNNYSKIKYSLIVTIINFLTLSIFLIQSKMVLLLYLVSLIILCISNKNYSYIFNVIVNILYAFIISTLVYKYNVYLTVILALIVYYMYTVIIRLENVKKYSSIINTLVIISLITILVINSSLVTENKIIFRLDEYFTNFDSTKLRLVYYKDALKLVTETPLNFIFGIGGNGFRTMYETVQTSEYISLETHSFFIQILVESGILGLATILIVLGYILIKAKNNIYKFMLVILIIFSAFDVYLTYTFMLFVLAILMASCDINLKEESKKDKVINGILFVIVFVINTCAVLAFFIQPLKVNEVNNTLEQQEKVIKQCELSLRLDPYDLDYIQNYNIACKTYLNIMDIKKQIYGTDDIKKRNEIVNIIENNLKEEIKYEKSNKYVIEDVVYYSLRYLDQLVIANYSDNIQQGYEYYLVFIMQNLQKLKLDHSYNELSMEIYNDSIKEIYDKFSSINELINSEIIRNILESIKENVYISL